MNFVSVETWGSVSFRLQLVFRIRVFFCVSTCKVFLGTPAAAGISFKYGLDILKNEPQRSFNERYNDAQGEWENPFAEIIGMNYIDCKLSSPFLCRFVALILC